MSHKQGEFEWNINPQMFKNRLLVRSAQRGIDSPDFHQWPITLRLAIFPNGTNSANKGWFITTISVEPLQAIFKSVTFICSIFCPQTLYRKSIIRTIQSSKEITKYQCDDRTLSIVDVNANINTP